MTRDEWLAKASELFGNDMMKWSFVCPSCGHVASVQDYKNAGAPSSAIAFSCVGRWMDEKHEAFQKGKGPCNYSGGGLFAINPVEVDGDRYFDFAPPSEQ
jgi:hypothetical protein